MQFPSISLHRIIFLLTLAFVMLVMLAPSSALEFLRVEYSWVDRFADFLDLIAPGVDFDHLSAFVALGFAVRFGWPTGRARHVAVGLLALASLTEFIQIWIPGRVASPFHTVMDVVGGMGGFGVAWLLTYAWGHEALRDHHPH